MRSFVLAPAVLFLAACATSESSAPDQPDAVADFIELNNLQKQSRIRDFSNPNHLPVNKRYIIAYVSDAQYLIEYVHDCYLAERSMSDRPMDKRRYPSSLYARTDYYRGCPVRAIYPITLAQTQELVNIGRAPGE
jgi:hypothetical protein